MEKNLKIKSINGYDIPLVIYEIDMPKAVIICCHGFASYKKNNTLMSVKEEINNLGITIVSLDFPAHGESLVDGKYFTLQNSINDIKSVYDYAKQVYLNKDIYMFGTSFGAYAGLLAKSKYNLDFKKIICRSPAINMKEAFLKVNNLDEKKLEEYKEKDSLTVGFDYNRFVISYNFYEELIENNLIEKYIQADEKIVFVQGTEDEVADVKYTEEFCKKNTNTRLVKIENTGHRFLDDYSISILKDEIEKFLK